MYSIEIKLIGLIIALIASQNLNSENLSPFSLLISLYISVKVNFPLFNFRNFLLSNIKIGPIKPIKVLYIIFIKKEVSISEPIYIL